MKHANEEWRMNIIIFNVEQMHVCCFAKPET